MASSLHTLRLTREPTPLEATIVYKGIQNVRKTPGEGSRYLNCSLVSCRFLEIGEGITRMESTEESALYIIYPSLASTKIEIEIPTESFRLEK